MVKKYLVRENIFFIFTLILCIAILSHFIFPFGLGVTFAYLLEPLVEKLLQFFPRKKKFWQWMLSISLILMTLILIFGPILTLFTTAIQELIAVLSSLQNKNQGADLVFLFAQKMSLVLQRFGFEFSIDEIVLKFSDVAKNVSHALLVYVGSALYATPEFILKFFVFFLTWCFFLVKGKEWRSRFLVKILPWKQERELIANTCASVLKALIVSNVLVAIIQSFLLTLTLALFGVPRYILLGMIAFFISFIPIIGTAPLTLCAAAWCYFSQGRLFAAIGILTCGVLISLLDNFLRPFLMKGGAEIQFFWIFLAILGGMSLFGIPGAVIGPVGFALFAAALKTCEQTTES